MRSADWSSSATKELSTLAWSRFAGFPSPIPTTAFRSSMRTAVSWSGYAGSPICRRELRELIEQELDQREFMPVLSRIVRISANSEPCEWEVETDRGRTTFLLKTDEDVRRIDDRRAMITDSNGIPYLIENIDALDSKSRRYLERYL